MTSLKAKRHFKALGKICFSEHVIECSSTEHPTFAKHQDVGESFRDLFNMVGNQNSCGCIDTRSENTQRANEVFTTSKIESSGRFIEKEKTRFGHQGSGQQDSLLLPRGQGGEAAIGQSTNFHSLKAVARSLPIGVVIGMPPRFKRRVLCRHDNIGRNEVGSELIGHS
jgi:hypothetical protein